MTVFIVDVEADGPVPGLYSMVSFGAVKLDRELKTEFYGETRPISDVWIPEALAVSKITREIHLEYADPKKTMMEFCDWVKANTKGRAVLMSDNNGFDAMFISYYMHAFVGENPFGHSSRRIGDFYAGLTKDFYAATKWKYLRKTKHTHFPVDDARGNAEALLAMLSMANLHIPD